MGTGRKGNCCQKMQSRVSWKQHATVRGMEQSSVRVSCDQSLEILPHKSAYHLVLPGVLWMLPRVPSSKSLQVQLKFVPSFLDSLACPRSATGALLESVEDWKQRFHLANTQRRPHPWAFTACFVFKDYFSFWNITLI